MPKKVPPVKTDYSLEIRFKDSSGEWSKWVNKGKGAFQTIEIVQSQIRILASQYQGKEKEVRFEWNGWLCDFAGLPTGEVIALK
jgi:hypothetical protein